MNEPNKEKETIPYHQLHRFCSNFLTYKGEKFVSASNLNTSLIVTIMSAICKKYALVENVSCKLGYVLTYKMSLD